MTKHNQRTVLLTTYEIYRRSYEISLDSASASETTKHDNQLRLKVTKGILESLGYSPEPVLETIPFNSLYRRLTDLNKIK